MEWIAIIILFGLVLVLFYNVFWDYPKICINPPQLSPTDSSKVLSNPRYYSNFDYEKDKYKMFPAYWNTPKELSVDDVIRLVIKELDIQKIPATNTPESVISRK